MQQNIYDLIDELLKERQWSRRKLARMAGINASTISMLFCRRPERIPDKYLEQIAAALGISSAKLKGAQIMAELDKMERDEETLAAIAEHIGALQADDAE